MHSLGFVIMIVLALILSGCRESVNNLPENIREKTTDQSRQGAEAYSPDKRFKRPEIIQKECYKLLAIKEPDVRYHKGYEEFDYHIVKGEILDTWQQMLGRRSVDYSGDVTVWRGLDLHNDGVPDTVIVDSEVPTFNQGELGRQYLKSPTRFDTIHVMNDRVIEPVLLNSYTIRKYITKLKRTQEKPRDAIEEKRQRMVKKELGSVGESITFNKFPSFNVIEDPAYDPSGKFPWLDMYNRKEPVLDKYGRPIAINTNDRVRYLYAYLAENGLIDSQALENALTFTVQNNETNAYRKGSVFFLQHKGKIYVHLTILQVVSDVSIKEEVDKYSPTLNLILELSRAKNVNFPATNVSIKCALVRN